MVCERMRNIDPRSSTCLWIQARSVVLCSDVILAPRFPCFPHLLLISLTQLLVLAFDNLHRFSSFCHCLV